MISNHLCPTRWRLSNWPTTFKEISWLFEWQSSWLWVHTCANELGQVWFVIHSTPTHYLTQSRLLPSEMIFNRNPFQSQEIANKKVSWSTGSVLTRRYTRPRWILVNIPWKKNSHNYIIIIIIIIIPIIITIIIIIIIISTYIIHWIRIIDGKAKGTALSHSHNTNPWLQQTWSQAISFPHYFITLGIRLARTLWGCDAMTCGEVDQSGIRNINPNFAWEPPLRQVSIVSSLQASFWTASQPMRDNGGIMRRHSLAEPIPRMILAFFHWVRRHFSGKRGPFTRMSTGIGQRKKDISNMI